MFDLPRVIGVGLLVTYVALRVTHVREITDRREAQAAEARYRYETIGAV